MHKSDCLLVSFVPRLDLRNSGRVRLFAEKYVSVFYAQLQIPISRDSTVHGHTIFQHQLSSELWDSAAQPDTGTSGAVLSFRDPEGAQAEARNLKDYLV